MGDSEKFVFVIEGQHGEITSCTVQENGFNDAAVQKKQKGWFDGQCSEFTDDVGSLLAALGDV